MVDFDGERSERVIRLAVVMNGGVSLAVWMGGVTHEMDRLLGRSGGAGSTAWQEILDVKEDANGNPMPRRRVVVDYVAGTSAGGLNGCLLATAIARGNDLPALKDLWMEKGRLKVGVLLPGNEDRGQSILDGKYFHEAIHEVVESIGESTDESQDVSLLVTSTALARKNDANKLVAEDTSGNRLEIKDHRRVYLFHSPGRTADGMSQFQDTATLALAARASASFPAAFAPVKESPELAARRADGPRDIDPKRPAWLIDGGVLDNAPFEPLLDEMVRRPRPDHGPRWVVYVVPSAIDRSRHSDEEPAADVPPTWSTVLKSLWGTKSEVDLRSDLEKLRRLQAESRAAHVRPEEFIVTSAAAAIDVTPLMDSYKETRADGFAQFLRETHSTTEKLGTRPIDPQKVAELLNAQPLFIPEALQPTRDRAWQWGVTVAQRLLLWMSRDARSTPANPALVVTLANAERTMNGLAAQVMELYAPQRFANSDPDYVAMKTEEEFAGLMRTAASEMSIAITEWADSRSFEVDDAWTRLLRTEVLENHAEWHVRSAPSPFDVLLINPGSPSVDQFVLPPGTRPPDQLRANPNAKLYGTRLGHFAGFGAEEYRAHDWLWGRLDAAACLTSALLKDVDGDIQNNLRQALMNEILREEDSNPRKLAKATAQVEALDGPRLVADMLKRGQVDTADLTESIIDTLLPTEGVPIVDTVADAIIHHVSDTVDSASHVARGVIRVTDQIKSAAKRFIKRMNVFE